MELHMSRSLKGPTAYRDIIPALEEALWKPVIMIECGTTAAAVKLVQRMNQYRILDRKLNHENRLKKELPPLEGPNDVMGREYRALEMRNRENLMYLRSQYDILVIRRRDSLVLIERRETHPWVKIMDGEGNEIEVKPFQVVDPYKEIESKEFDRVEQRNKISGGTTQAPREKFDPSKPLSLTDDTDE
jgi:hypothetical protein